MAALLYELIDGVVVVNLNGNAVNNTHDHLVTHGEEVARVDTRGLQDCKTLGSLLALDNHV